MYRGLINKYRERLPLAEDCPVITLNEGNTPLIHCQNIIKHFAYPVELYVKYEGLNPTCSFKDRGMTVAVSQAVADGAKAIICASTGNTSAAAAAFAARAGLHAFVIIPEGNIAFGKLAQATIHGAKVMQIQGNFDEGMAVVKSFADNPEVAIVNSINPYRLQGQKTASFEIIEQLGRVPDVHALPVGNAGNISAHWMGYTEYFEEGTVDTRPQMLGCQAEGAAPFMHGSPISQPETVASAIRIGAPQSWDKALNAVDQSMGKFTSVTDEEILAAQRLLARTEGVFCEPASAASIAGLQQQIKQGWIKEGATVVCTLTGQGLKDPDVAIENSKDMLFKVESDERSVLSFLEEKMK